MSLNPFHFSRSQREGKEDKAQMLFNMYFRTWAIIAGAISKLEIRDRHTYRLSPSKLPFAANARMGAGKVEIAGANGDVTLMFGIASNRCDAINSIS